MRALEHARARRRRSGGSSTTWPPAATTPDEIVDYVAGMTDRFALAYARARPVVALIKDTSVDEVKAAADMVAVVSGRTQLRKAGARFLGRCPFHDERTPSFSVNATDKLYYCFGCGARATSSPSSARRSSSTSPARSSGSPIASTSRSSTRRRRRSRTLAVAAASGCSSCSTRRRRFYERYLWESQAGSLARDYLAGRGLGEEVCREYRLGLALGGTTLARKALEKRLHSRGARRSRPREPARQRLLLEPVALPALPTREAACSASRRGSSARTIRCARST